VVHSHHHHVSCFMLCCSGHRSHTHIGTAAVRVLARCDLDRVPRRRFSPVRSYSLKRSLRNIRSHIESKMRDTGRYSLGRPQRTRIFEIIRTGT
jgi:hypothetical protein